MVDKNDNSITKMNPEPEWFCIKCEAFFEEPIEITVWINKKEEQLSVCPYCQGYVISPCPIGVASNTSQSTNTEETEK